MAAELPETNLPTELWDGELLLAAGIALTNATSTSSTACRNTG